MIKIVENSEKKAFNSQASHPLQSWEWGDFRLKTGIEVFRLGRFENKTITETALITLHPIPFTKFKIGYFPKGRIPSSLMLYELLKLGVKENLIFIKMEPNVVKEAFDLNKLNRDFPIVKSIHPLFTKYTFRLDLTKSLDELLKNMQQKTRYNIRLAEKKGIKIQEENSKEAFVDYLHLMEETTMRQKFYAHTGEYHRLMWETLHPVGMAKLFMAKYRHEDRQQNLVSWILFLFNNVLYYPYGASSTLFRNFMPSNLMMWEAIKFGKKSGAKEFDMWGALGPEPSPSDPWYGFHKFKEGYGAVLTELAGSYDLVIKPAVYSAYNFTHFIRELYLKLKR